MSKKCDSSMIRYEVSIEDKKSNVLLRDFVYAESLVLAYEKAQKTIDTLNSKNNVKWVLRELVNTTLTIGV